MISTYFFIIISMVYNIILCYLFFHKTRVKSPEIRIFGWLLVTNFIGLFLELYNRFSIITLGADNVFIPYTSKLYLLYYIVYIVLFFKYFLAISFSIKKYKKYSIIFNIFSLLATIGCGYMIYKLPVIINTDNGIYLTGNCVETVFSLMSIFLVLIILIYMIRYRHIDKNKYISCLSFMILSCLFGVVQKYFPFITLSTAMQTVVLYIIYNTIENPDVKMLHQINLAKLLMEEANNNKKEAISDISHDIRIPLNSIIGFSEDIKKYENKLPLEVKEDINYILESSNNILDAVDSLNDIKDIVTTDLELTLKPYSLKKEVNRIKNKFKTEIDDNINFVVNIDDNIPEKLVGDKTYISEIISNILSMSLKNTNNGEIELYVKIDTNKNKCNILFIVKDSGKGYKKDELYDLRNIGDDDNIKIDENNILFAITKNLVSLMEGKLEIESKHNNGSTVSIIIPQDVYVEEKDEDTEISINYSNKHILVVDDNELNIKVLSRALSDFKVNIDSVLSGEEALDKIAKGNEYDLILMDILMPKLSGVETLNKLKEDKKFNTPVVALTADVNKEAKEKYLSYGFNDYISKPFSKKEIKMKIHTLFK